MQLMFGDDNFHDRKFRNLTTFWLVGDVVFIAQRMSTIVALLGEMLHNLINAFDGKERARVPTMAWLSSGLLAGFFFLFVRFLPPRIGRWRLGSGLRVLL